MDTRVLHLIAFAVVIVTNFAVAGGYINATAVFPVYFVVGVAEAIYFVNAMADPRVRAAMNGAFTRASMVAEGIGIITLLVSGVISFVIVAALFPTVDNASYQLQQAVSKSNNTLIKALAPVIPYLIGLGLFIVILIPVNMLVDTVRRRLGGGAI